MRVGSEISIPAAWTTTVREARESDETRDGGNESGRGSAGRRIGGAGRWALRAGRASNSSGPAHVRWARVGCGAQRQGESRCSELGPARNGGLRWLREGSADGEGVLQSQRLS